MLGASWDVNICPGPRFVQMELSPEQGVRLRRAASRYLKSMRKKKPRHKNRAPGMWWLSNAPTAWDLYNRINFDTFAER